MKLAIHEYFTAIGLDGEDLPLLHYMTDRLESVKFIKWSQSVTFDTIDNFDDEINKTSM